MGSKFLVEWGETMGSKGLQGMKKIPQNQHNREPDLKLLRFEKGEMLGFEALDASLLMPKHLAMPTEHTGRCVSRPHGA